MKVSDWRFMKSLLGKEYGIGVGFIWESGMVWAMRLVAGERCVSVKVVCDQRWRVGGLIRGDDWGR